MYPSTDFVSKSTTKVRPKNMDQRGQPRKATQPQRSHISDVTNASSTMMNSGLCTTTCTRHASPPPHHSPPNTPLAHVIFLIDNTGFVNDYSWYYWSIQC
eukprot:970022_1